jgi:hypothetical protein
MPFVSSFRPMSLYSKDLTRVLAIALLVVTLPGCGQHDQIASYTVPKPELVDPTLASPASTAAAAAEEQQTLGLIVPVGKMGWFFKLTGAVRAVEPQHEAFLQFITSIKFSGEPDAKPSWTLPEGWKEMPGSQMRFATIQIAAEGKPLELSVIPLQSADGDTQKYLLANVNRWRDQLKLKPISADELATTTKPVKIGGHEATLVSLVGTGSGRMSGTPFAPFVGGATPTVNPRSAGPPPANRPQSPSRDQITYDVPPEWTSGTKNAFSIAAFKAADGDQQVAITISKAGGDLSQNVNRWRGQLGLEPINAAELAKLAQKIETLGTAGDYVELIGPQGAARQQTILGVRAATGDDVWFVKLMGDAALAEREKPRFESFVKSLKLR